jgi:DNA-binding CsgD family transcriptional regulator/tetratricopeptide (TPR) repeat protein
MLISKKSQLKLFTYSTVNQTLQQLFLGVIKRFVHILKSINYPLYNLFKTGLIACLFLCSYTAWAFNPDTILSHKSIFEQVKDIPENSRVLFATTLYTNSFRKADEAVVKINLKQLTLIARCLKDKRLECAVLDMYADYYFHAKNVRLCVLYYQKAIGFAKEHNLTFEIGLYEYKLGMRYAIDKQNVLACEYFLKAQEIFEQIGYKNIPDISYYLYKIANFYYGLGDFENSRIILKTALKYAPENKRNKINVINTIALIYRSTKQYPDALTAFNNALQVAVASKDSVWMGIIKGNIGSVYFLQHDYQRALPLIETDYVTSMENKEEINGVIALLRLIKINIDYKKLAIARQQLQTAEAILLRSNYNVLEQWTLYYDLKAQLYELMGKSAESVVLREKFEQDKDSLIKRDNIAAIERVKLNWEIDKRITQLNKLRAEEKIDTIEVYSAVAVLILLIIISALVYNRQSLKNKKDKELLIAQKHIVDEELKNASLSLSAFTENLKQKNTLIENFKQEIELLNQRSSGQEDAGYLEKLLQANLMTDGNWTDFKRLFTKVHPGFFINLSKNYPQLSATDIRILSLIKLGLNNTEMANMLGITIEGIKKAKQRLRKKVDVDNVMDGVVA